LLVRCIGVFAPLERYKKLSQTNAIPKQQLDAQVALVLQNQGNIISDKAQIDTANLNITYCHIIAPVTGRSGCLRSTRETT
jgi:membrane fusion protein, multidrug efflux system